MAQITLNSTGVASSGALVLQSNGTTTAVTVDTSQNVGVGTSSPSSKLDVSGVISLQGTTLPSAGTARIFSRSSDNNTYFQTGSGNTFYVLDGSQNTMYSVSPTSHIWAISNTERARIDSSGNLLVGTTASTALSSGQIQVGTTSASDSAIQMLASTTGTSGLYFGDGTTGNDRLRGAIEYANNGDSLRLYTGATERIRIDSSGNFLMGKTALADATAGFQIYNGTTGSIGIGADGTAGHNHIEFFRGTTNALARVGTIASTGSATTYSTSSDYRLKENIAPMTSALSVVSQLKPCTYKWKLDGSDGQGFIAHELAEVVPDAVTGEKDAVNENGSIKPQGIDTSFLVATLTAAIQELNTKFEAYKSSHP